MSSSAALLERAFDGHVPSQSRLITALESDSELGVAVRPPIYAKTGRAYVLGVTGVPGSGKSTLVNACITELRKRGSTVAVVAIDPSSSFTGGAILGDRIRMQEHTADGGTFVRSMSTRGWLGGISRATIDAVAVLDASGWDTVIVETVGVGQAEVEIMQLAHTTVVVSVPGLGDDIQAIKSGLLEIADIHVVNKADRPDANRAIAELTNMLELSMPLAGGWSKPVLATAAINGAGIPELVDALGDHREWLRLSGTLAEREHAAARARIRGIAGDLALRHVAAISESSDFAPTVAEVAARRLDPYAAAAGLLERLGAIDTAQEAISR